MSETEIKRKITVIFATDVVGYSKHMEAHESDTVRSLRECEAIMGELFQKHGGRLFNTGGDSFLAEFSSAVDAVECGVEFQRAMQARNKLDTTAVKLEFRIGINSGDVVKENENLLGDGVNIAARLEALAQTNGITISKIIHDFVSGKTSYEFADLGTQKVKENEFRAFDLILEGTERRSSEISGSEYDFESKVGDRPAVLILPFENQTGSRDNDYLNNGITEDVIATLSKSKQLSVPTSETGRFVTENGLTEQQIRDEFGVKFILRGFVQGSTARMRINIQMTETSSSEIVWSEIFDFKDDRDIFDIQDTISVGILDKLNLDANAIVIGLKHFKEPEAYKKYIYARSELQTHTHESLSKARKLLEQAASIEPNNVEIINATGFWYFAHGNLSQSENSESDYLKALEIGIETHDYALIGVAEIALGRLESASLRPKQMEETGMTDGHALYTALAGLIRHSCGAIEEAMRDYTKSIEIGPHAFSIVRLAYSFALCELGRFEEAIVYAKKYIDGNFANPRIALGLKTTMIYALLKTQKDEEARKLHESLVADGNSILISETKNFMGQLGRTKFATEFFTEISSVVTT